MWENQFIKIGEQNHCLVETTTLQWKGKWVRVEYMRKNHPGSSWPEMNFACIRDMETDEVIADHIMPGFELHSAIVWDDNIYLFATDYWNIYMCKSFDLNWWSKPMMVLNNRNMQIHHQNNSVCWDGKRFIMAVDLLGGPYDFTVCFAYSYDLQEFHYIPGAVYRADLYTSSPKIYHVDGWYYLLHVRNIDKNPWWHVHYLGKPSDKPGDPPRDLSIDPAQKVTNYWFETFVSRSRNLLTWEDAPHNPVLSADPTVRIEYLDGGTKPECNVGDLFVYERDGKTIGDYHGGTQEAGTRVKFYRAEFPGTMAEFFRSYFEE